MTEQCGKNAALLAGDIGATKTILALFDPEADPRKPLLEREIPTAAYDGIESLVAGFLEETGHSVKGAVFGIAAPVKNGRAVMINLPWVIEEERLMRDLGIEPVCFLNDLEAIANAVPILKAEDLSTLNEGVPDPAGTIAVIAPGTGLGEAFLVPDGKRFRSRPSEGGHADFAPSNSVEIDLLRHLHQKFEHVSYERVCSGPGIYNIYEFLKSSGLAKPPDWLLQEMAGTGDPTPVIVNAATSGEKSCRICEMALEIFTSILGAEAGNLALKVLATHGVYVAGGIPPRILDYLERGKFMQSFRGKGRESFLLESIPVRVVLNRKAGLIGAAAYGLNRF